MPDPVNPKLDNDSLYELISKPSPSLTPEVIYWLGQLAGYDLTPPQSDGSANDASSSATPSRE